MTQWQRAGYARLATPKLIAATERHVQLIQLNQRSEPKPANLGWLKTYFECLANQTSISSG